MERLWRLFFARVFLGCLLVLGASHPTVAQDSGDDFGITGVMVGGGADIRRATGVLPHSPAAEAGIEKGDTILAINGVGVAGLELNEFVAKMRGKPGSEVIVVVMSHETGVAFSATLKRVSYFAYHETNPSY